MIKKLIIKITLFLFVVLLFFGLSFWAVTQGITTKLTDSYQYVLNRKYNNLMTAKSPKIIFISGSSSAFGLDSKTVEEKTGMRCANMALHAGFGLRFETNLARDGIRKGDIVVLAYEYDAYYNDNFNANLVVTGIDNNINMYQYIPAEHMKRSAFYFPTYLFKKIDLRLNYADPFSGAFSAKSFNQSGNMVLDRPKCVLPTPLPLSLSRYESEDFKINKFDKNCVEYINSFIEYSKGKGATVLISFPPVINEAVTSSKENIQEYQKTLERKINAPVISDINNYILPRSDFYNSIYHCNNTGEAIRTEKVIADIEKYIKSH